MNRNFFKKIMAVIITSIIIFFNITYIVSAATEINFNNITIREGLPQGTVETLFQDSDGYMWFGTNDGLVRYNGYEYYVYQVEEDGKNCISNNYILDIKEDKYKNIWVGTASGLSKIHKDRKTITNYWEGGKGNLSHNNIASIIITRKQEILLATPDGINIYNEASDSFSRIFEGDQLVDQYINSLTEDDKGNIWVGTEGGVSKINLEQNTSEHFVYKEDDDESISSDEIYKVYYDPAGFVWGGTYSSGIFKIRLSDNKITRYIAGELEEKSLGGEFVKTFLRDSNGTLWVGTQKGLSKYNDATDDFTTFTSKIYDVNSLVNNNIFSIIEDSTGLIWIGTYSGVSMFNPNNKIEHYKNDPFDEKSLTNNMVATIYEDSQGYIWIGNKGNGVDILNQEKEKIYNINYKNDGSSILSKRVNYITGDKEYIYIGTTEGLSIINKNNNTVENYTEENGLPNRNVKHVLVDNGNLWISTINGLVVLDLKKKEITDLSYIIKKYSPNDNYVEFVYKDSAGEYWIGMFVQGGLLRLNPSTMEVKVYKHDANNKNSITNNAVRVVNEDSNGNIWIGTSFGLNRLDKKDDIFTSYTTKDGMPNNLVYGILIDEMQNPWISTNKGISKLDVKTNEITNLTIADGLQSTEFNGKAYFKNSNGEFYFGGVNGLNVIKPQFLNEQITVGELRFHDFSVNGAYVDGINNKVLKSTENNIHIEAFIPNYGCGENIKYYYTLDKINEEWIEMDGNAITLSNLASGNYTLKALATIYNEPSNIVEVNFTVNGPFWRSPEAILVYIILIFIYVVYKQIQVEKLDRLVDERTKDLSDEMKKSEKLFNQVLELEKRKNTYLINMSHELRTPLNVIHSTEQLIRELNKTEQGIEKENLKNYMSIMRNNVSRLLKIINDLIDTSKIEYGNYVLNIEEVDIVYIVEETALSLKGLTEKKGLDLIIDPEIEEKIIEADKAEIERCIVNIVGNAIKHTDKGGSIQVSVLEVDDMVKIEISDTGVGIDKKYHDTIFNRFSQVVDNNAESKGGSGLGLTITKKIIELHKGDIFVESEVGKGSKFIIILPTKQKI